MRLHQIGLLSAAVLLGSAALFAADKTDVAELTKQLTGEKPAVARTAEQLEAVYAQVLDSLMPDLASEEPGKRNSGQATLEKIAFQTGRPDAEAGRLACAKAVAARLGPAAGPLARVLLLRQLERIGRAEVVPQVAALMSDADALVRESARRALQKNPAKEANEAIRTAMVSADAPAWRAALVAALTMRRDPSNLAVLQKEAASANDDVRIAAMLGLAAIGDASSAETIAAAMDRGGPMAKKMATEAYLRLAQSLARQGNRAAALGLYKRLLTARGHLKCAAVIGIGVAGSRADLPTVFEAAADQDVRVRGACVEALCLLKGNEVTAAIVAKIATAKPEAKLALLQALARRGDKGTAGVLLAAASDSDEAIQAAALAGLGAVGDVSAVPVLLKAIVSESKAVQDAARLSLQSLPGADVDKAVMNALVEKDPKARVEIIRVLAARHVVEASPALLKAAEDADKSVQSEALKALGLVAPSSALPALIALLVKTEDAGFRGEAAGALVKITNRDQDFENRCDPIVSAASTATGPAKFALLSTLGRIGGRQSLAALRAAIKSDDEKVRDAGIRALIEWPDASAATDMLELAKTAANKTHQIIALRGYLRVCSIRTNRPGRETIKLLLAGLDAASRPEEKRQAIGALCNTPDIKVLAIVVPYLDDPALKEEAAYASYRIGRSICNGHPEAVRDALLKAIAVSRNENLKADAKEVLATAEEKLKAKAKK